MLNVTLEELLEAGSHFGHQIRRWNPKMAPYIYAQNEGVHVFDLAQTREGLLEACRVLTQAAKDNKTILFVGTKRQAREIVENAAKNTGMPFVTTRWIGGLLTNFEQMRRSVKKLEEMKKNMSEGKYEDHTKMERLLMDRDIAKLERIFGGVVSLTKMPDYLFVVDTKEEATAVFEAKKLNIPVIGIVDTNADPTIIDHPIPANDDALKSIELLVGSAEKAILEGQGKEVEKKEPASDKKAAKAKKEDKKEEEK
jgi:small subunit ribosomal protein S2